MGHDLDALPAGFVQSLSERFFATLATVRGDGRYGPTRIPTDVVIEIDVDRAVGMWP